jgi:phosphatidylinositol alpha-1,6-mannosyltransferase
MMNKTPKIHVWLPGLFDYKGGIQVYSAFFVRALEQVLPNGDRQIFLKNDQRQTEDLRFDSETQFHFAGRWKDTLLHTPFFVAQVLIAAVLNRPDIIICGHVNFSPLAAQVSNLLNIPYWVIVHGIDVWNLDDPTKIRSLKSADKIISVSQYTGDRLIKEQNISPEKIHLLPNTFDEQKLSINQKPDYLLNRYQFSVDQLIILTVARLSNEERYKGYDKIIQALPAIQQQIPNIHYLLVGKGPDRDRIETIIDEVKVIDCVTLAGFAPDEELEDHYNLCDVFAMPSKGEGFGIVYLEALACGKPTVGGNQDGAIDALCNGELGVLVDPDDLTEISTVITKILQKTYPLPILYQPETLRKKVIEIYGFEQFKQNLAQLLSAQFKQTT